MTAEYESISFRFGTIYRSTTSGQPLRLILQVYPVRNKQTRFMVSSIPVESLEKGQEVFSYVSSSKPMSTIGSVEENVYNSGQVIAGVRRYAEQYLPSDVATFMENMTPIIQEYAEQPAVTIRRRIPGKKT